MKRIIGLILLILYFIGLGVGLVCFLHFYRGVGFRDTIFRVLISYAITGFLLLIASGIVYLLS